MDIEGGGAADASANAAPATDGDDTTRGTQMLEVLALMIGIFTEQNGARLEDRDTSRIDRPLTSPCQTLEAGPIDP